MPDPREAKLPKWARGELATLRRKVEDAERRAEAARLATGPEDSDTIIDPYDQVPIRLGKGTRVRFLMGDNTFQYFDVHVEQTFRGPRLDIHAGTGFEIRPLSGNHMEARIND